MSAYITESKLQHRHSRDVMAIAQCDHVGSNQAKVFGKKRQSTEFLPDPVKQFIARTIDPTSVDCGRFAGRNFPELCESAKVVEPDEVARLRRPAQALHPP